ncbi:hypothetical protein YC2023_016830 [Brassica napus]
MEGLADRLQRIESKFDMLATKVDLLISVKGKRVHVKKPKQRSVPLRNEDSEEKSVASVKMAAKVSSSFESEDEKETLATSSDSSDDGKSDQGEKVEQRMAKGDMKIGVVSYSGRWPLGGRFAGGCCGGLGRCGRC